MRMLQAIWYTGNKLIKVGGKSWCVMVCSKRNNSCDDLLIDRDNVSNDAFHFNNHYNYNIDVSDDMT